MASAVSQCDVSDDPDYAYSPKRAVQVGGGPMYLAARQRRFLDALRGPAGGPIKYKRQGQYPLSPPNSLIILDAYEVTYEGLDKPIVLYLNGYHFDDALKAPKGFTCGAAIPLGAPGPDPFEAMDSLVRVALQDTRSADAPGIPSTRQVRAAPEWHSINTVSLRERLERRRLPENPSPTIATRPAPTVWGRGPWWSPFRARAKESSHGQRASSSRRNSRMDSVLQQSARGNMRPATPRQRWCRDYEVPPLAVAATFSLETLRPNETIRIAYDEPCPPSSSVVVRVRHTAAQLLTSPSPVLPPGAPPSQPYLRLQVTINLNGSFQDPTYIGGAEQLFEAASEAVQDHVEGRTCAGEWCACLHRRDAVREVRGPGVIVSIMKHLPVVLLLLLASAPAVPADQVNKERMQADLEFLCSPPIEGRVSLSRGADAAAWFLAAEMRKIGLQPTVDGGFLQRFDVVPLRVDREQSSIHVVRNGAEQAFAASGVFFPEPGQSIESHAARRLRRLRHHGA